MEGLHQTLSQLPQCLLVSILHRSSYLFYYESLTHTAPSAAPTSVSVSEVTSSSITVQWGAVPCIHHNGNITGYSVQYGVLGSGSILIISVSGGSVTQVTISNLISSTFYSIQVAAVNSEGTGISSELVFSETSSSSQVSSPAESDTAAIIGGVVAVVIVVGIVIIVAILAVVIVVIKSRQTNGDVVIKKE